MYETRSNDFFIFRWRILKFLSVVCPCLLWPSRPGSFRKVKTMSRPRDVVGEEGVVNRSECSRIQEEKIRLLPVSVHPDGQQNPVILSLSSYDQPVRLLSLQPHQLTWLGQELHLWHVVILSVQNLHSQCWKDPLLCQPYLVFFTVTEILLDERVSGDGKAADPVCVAVFLPAVILIYCWKVWRGIK